MIVEKGKIPYGWIESKRLGSTTSYLCYKCNRSHNVSSKIGIEHSGFEGIDCYMKLTIRRWIR